ncbi:MAG TPA: monooxygenase [Acidimicrobiia bacterium]|nr:monooxygenase [Acidimicrobiia bacterium]
MGWPRVLIAGGSIGGLTTGVLLSELGCDVEIYERSDRDLEDRGAGIVVLPVTERYFEQGDGSGPKRVSLELTYWNYVDASGTTIASHEDHFRFSGWSTIYRALLDVFDSGSYHYDHEVIGLTQLDDGVSLEFGNGSRADGDMAVFADGMNSTGRSILLPEVVPEYAGYVAWRGTVPEGHLSPETQETVADAMVYQVLDHGHILVYAIPGPTGDTEPPNRVINFVWYRNYPTGGPFENLMTDAGGGRRTGTMPPGQIRPEHLAELHSTATEVLAPQMSEIVLACGSPLIQAVFDVASPRMAFDRTCLLGDAATTLRPHVAAGQAKACADAWALRDALAATHGHVLEALALWEPVQLDLARTALARTRQMGIASQYEGSMQPGDPDWKFGLWEPGN